MAKKILRFSAEWCQPCKMLARNLELAEIQLPIEYINIDEQPERSIDFKIRSVPTLVLCEDGQEVKRLTGVKTPDELKEWIK